MLSLAENRENYSTFYDRINQYRKNVSNDYPNISRFKAQKKTTWRKNEAKKNQISRHKT